MVGTAWELFVVLALVIATGVVALAKASAAMIATDDPVAGESSERLGSGGSPGQFDRRGSPERLDPGFSLLANVAVTHLAIVLVVGGVVWLTRVPTDVLGLGGRPDLITAVLLGVGTYALNEGFGLATKALGGVAPERYREFLAPRDAREWVVLLVGVLPILAFGEELLFRGVLVGGLAAATGLSPWVLVGLSSVAFGAAHTAQGRLGMAVTGLLGIVLAAAFVVTGDLLLVAIAHYLVNALEFVVHEGLGVEWHL